MRPYADSSFVVALLVAERNTDRAWTWLDANEATVQFSRLTELEVVATFHRLRVTNEITPKEYSGLRLRLEQMVLGSRRATPSQRLYPEAIRLIDHFSEGFACKSLDVLHVASARVMRAEVFLTFDDQQMRLAASASLKVQPAVS
jgi:predicted nucleic acid-binding protein